MFAQHWEFYGLGFLFALVLALWAVINVAQNARTSAFFKAVWIVFVLFVPFFGFAVWLFFGPRSGK